MTKLSSICIHNQRTFLFHLVISIKKKSFHTIKHELNFSFKSRRFMVTADGF